MEVAGTVDAYRNRERANVLSVARYVESEGWRSVRTLPRMRRLLARPVIVGGCGRSGTSLVTALIGAHSHILQVDRETEAFCPDATPDRGAVDIDHRRPRLDRLLIDLNRTEIPASVNRLVEKTPRNVRNYGGILRHFGERVRIVNIVRDGRDVVLSRHPYSGREHHVSPARWVHDVALGAKYEGRPQVRTVRYEDLVAEPDATMRGLLEFIGEPWEPVLEQFLAAPPTTSERRSGGEETPRRPPDPSSVDRWRTMPDAAPVRELLELPGAVDLLTHYGYLPG